METTTLATYLEKHPDSKRLNKRIARALKTYLHSQKDLSHAAEDIAHAKEDCAFAIHAAEQLIEDCRGIIAQWALPDQADASGEPDSEEPTPCCDEECQKCDCGDDESQASDEVEKHLRHAAKDIGHALADAESALQDLGKVDGLLFDIIEIAEEDGFELDFAETKAWLLEKANETLSASKPIQNPPEA